MVHECSRQLTTEASLSVLGKVSRGQLETVETETGNGKWKWKMETVKT